MVGIHKYNCKKQECSNNDKTISVFPVFQKCFIMFGNNIIMSPISRMENENSSVAREEGSVLNEDNFTR